MKKGMAMTRIAVNTATVNHPVKHYLRDWESKIAPIGYILRCFKASFGSFCGT
jgi:hypothetical protein